MNVCSKCGVKFDDDKLTCPMCGGSPMQNPGEEDTRPFTYESYETVGGRVYTAGSRRKIPWYCRWWAIILAIILCWPVAIVLFILRLIRSRKTEDVRYFGPGGVYGEGPGGGAPNGTYTAGAYKGETKRSIASEGKTWWMVKVFIGGCLIAAGIIGATGVTEANSIGEGLTAIWLGVACVAGGAALILYGRNGFLARRRRTRYEAAINNRGNTRISFIAKEMGRDEDKVKMELQDMLNDGFLMEPELGIGAYINGEYDLLVMTRNGVPIVPVEKTMAEEIAEANERIKKQQEQNRRDSAKTVEDRFILAIEDVIAKGASDEVKSVLQGIEGSVIRIDKLIKREPAMAEHKSVVSMKSKYIPAGLELLTKYQTDSVSADSKKSIEDMFTTMAQAFANIEKQLTAHNDNDTEIDIEVLRQTLEREGLLDSDFDIKVN